MTKPRTPYSSDHKPPLTLAAIAQRARVQGGSRLAALEAENEALTRQSIERAEENHELRNRLQVAQLESAELRRLLLALLAGLDSLCPSGIPSDAPSGASEGMPDNWIVRTELERAASAQMAEARGVVGRE